MKNPNSFLGIILVLALLAIFNSCSSSAEETSKKEDEIPTIESKGVDVDVQVISDAIFYSEIFSNGEVGAKNQVDLHFNKNNHIEEIYFNNGDLVKKGQVIAKLVSTEEEHKLSQAKNSFRKAQLELEDQKINFGYSGKSDSEIPKEMLENIMLRSGYHDAKIQMDLANQALENCKITAPFDGVIANITQNNGDKVENSKEFCKVYSKGKLKVVFHVMQHELTKLYVGQKISLWPLYNKDKLVAGKIVEINPLIDDNSLIRVEASIDSNDLLLGTKVNIKILREVEDLVAIPKTALVIRSNKDVVFTCNKGYSKWNYVNVVAENDQYFGLDSGVSIGDTVIVRGNMNMAHDSKISISSIN
jgi:membrane fusion protein, multidrug efflux system